MREKTASLFAAACEVGAIIADVDDNKRQAVKNYGFYLGMLFQITDDILDYDASRSKLGKTVGDDFREGKMTAPVLYAIQKSNEDEKEFWTRTLQDRNQQENDLDTAFDFIKRHGAMKQAKQLAQTYCEKAQNTLTTLHPDKTNNPLYDLIEFVLERQK